MILMSRMLIKSALLPIVPIAIGIGIIRDTDYQIKCRKFSLHSIYFFICISALAIVKLSIFNKIKSNNWQNSSIKHRFVFVGEDVNVEFVFFGHGVILNAVSEGFLWRRIFYYIHPQCDRDYLR